MHDSLALGVSARPAAATSSLRRCAVASASTQRCGFRSRKRLAVCVSASSSTPAEAQELGGRLLARLGRLTQAAKAAWGRIVDVPIEDLPLEDRDYPGLLVAATLLVPLLLSGRIVELLENKVFIAGIVACFLAQVTKVFTERYRQGYWDIKAIWAFRGCPSSRTALCVGVTSALAVVVGFGSPLFATAAAFSMVVMGDSMGLCWHVGLHAHVLNQVIHKIKQYHPLSSMEGAQLREVLGHTPTQVFYGALIGFIVGNAYPKFF